jgi:hypothetical protein
LADFASSTHSQHGEDGIIAEILRRLGLTHRLNKWCVEFGAWDGVYLSNTARLIQQEGYSAVLIEGDPERAEALATSHADLPVQAICAYVGFDGDQCLDAILRSTPIPRDFDLLSVDIDGCDYHVWEALREYRPKVVAIEHNRSIPNAVEFIQARDAAVHHGSSAAALVALGREKGYTLVAVEACNVLLVADEYAQAVLGDERPTLQELRDDSEYVRYIFPGYDGTLFTSGPVKLPFQLDLPISRRRLQVVPAWLRTYNEGRTTRDVAVRAVSSFASSPGETTRLLWSRLRARH